MKERIVISFLEEYRKCVYIDNFFNLKIKGRDINKK